MRCVQQNMLPGRPHIRIICTSRGARVVNLWCALLRALRLQPIPARVCLWRTSLLESRSLIPASAWYRSYCSVGAVVAVPRPSVTQKWMKVLRRSWIWRVLFIRHCASSLFFVARMSDLLIECESEAIEFWEPIESVRSDCVVLECLSILERRVPSRLGRAVPASSSLTKRRFQIFRPVGRHGTRLRLTPWRRGAA